jgi:hypothetical protein
MLRVHPSRARPAHNPSERVRSSLDRLLGRVEYELRRTRRRLTIDPDNIVELDRATTATVASVPGDPVIRMSEENVQRLLDADAQH